MVVLRCLGEVDFENGLSILNRLCEAINLFSLLLSSPDAEVGDGSRSGIRPDCAPRPPLGADELIVVRLGFVLQKDGSSQLYTVIDSW